MKTYSDMVKYKKLRGREPLSFSNHIRRKKKSSMAEYILRHGISVAKDFTPETFGRLTTQGPRFLVPVGSQGRYAAKQVCKCSCSEDALLVVFTDCLRSGNTSSCGCFQIQQTKKAKTSHGRSCSGVYRILHGIYERTSNPNNPNYPNYGGRGISMCSRWREPNGQGFLNFRTDMGERPSLKHTIERKNNNGNYEPNNCRWATRTEQARNKRNSRNLEAFGKTQSVHLWAEEVGVGARTICSRIRIGWTVEKALTTPVRKLERKKQQ